jgi:hypothetical protein
MSGSKKSRSASASRRAAKAVEEDLQNAVMKVPEKCAPYLGTVMDLVVRYTLPIATAQLLAVVPEELREKVAFTIADSSVGAAAIVGSIFTASATKEVFGWGNNFNLNRSALSDRKIRQILNDAETRISGIEMSRMDEEAYRTWPTYAGPWSVLDAKVKGPVVSVDLGVIRDLVATAAKGGPDMHTKPDGSLSEDDWEAFMDVDEGLKALMETEEPVHIGYQFSLGPVAAVHHGLYFGQDSGPQGGLVIEVMNRRYGPQDEVVSFIAPSTLLSFLRRTSTNGLNGLLVYKYSQTIPLQVALERAKYAVGRFNYNVIKHNCENFVSWVLMNNDSNSTCVGFRTRVYKGARDLAGLGGGSPKRPSRGASRSRGASISRRGAQWVQAATQGGLRRPGALSRAAAQANMSTNAYACKVLAAPPGSYSPQRRKQAQFFVNINRRNSRSCRRRYTLDGHRRTGTVE